MMLAGLITGSLMAQPRHGRGFGAGQGWEDKDYCRPAIENVLSDLTEDQKDQLETLRLEHFKEMKDFRNQMGELRAKQKTIVSAYKVDQSAAEKLIDEKTALMNKQMKKRLAHQVAIKEVLTEEQVIQLEQVRKHRQYAGKSRQGFNARGNFRPHQGCPGYGRNF